jgi:hypothetical protein
MSNAAERLDLVEAARHDIARSKEIAASVAGDLHDYNRWFKTYLLEEQRKREKHARWVKHQQAVLRRREWRHRTVRSARRALVVAALGVRSAVQFVLNAARSALALLRDAILGAALWTARTAQTVAVTASRLVAAGLAWCTAKALALGRGLATAASAVSANAVTAALAAWTAGHAVAANGLSWAHAKARAFGAAAVTALSRAASWTAASTGSAASSGAAFLRQRLAWLGEKIRALAVLGTAATLTAVAAVTAKMQATTIATAETLAAIAERLGAVGTSLASRLRAQASNWSGAISAAARDLAPKLRDSAAAVSSSLRSNGLRLSHSARAKISAAQPMLREQTLHAATLASGFADRAWAVSERLSQSVLKPLEGLVASAPGSLRAPGWTPEPSGAGGGNGSHPTGAGTWHGSEAAGHGKALACIEPWRCRLPAVLPRQGGRQVLVVN